MLQRCRVHECGICVLIALGTLEGPLNKVKRKSFDNFAISSMLKSVLIVVESGPLGHLSTSLKLLSR